MNNERLFYESQFDYETLQKLKSHAQLYNLVSDKKLFLKNVIPYEQKLILLNSPKPYEVLSYLDELDLRSTRLILESLTKEEIKHIVGLFSSEDKERFYSTFSDLELVNEFIVQDRNAKEYVEDLSFDRKIDILNSSDNYTEKASEVIYDSMSNKEQDKVEEYITTADAASALNNISMDYSETIQNEPVVDEVVEISEPVIEESNEQNAEDLKPEINLEEFQQIAEQPKEQLEEQLNLNVKQPIEVTEEAKVTKFKTASAITEQEFINEINNSLAPSLETEETSKTL